MKEKLVQAALEAGARRAAPVSGGDIVFSESFRDICRSNQCGNYGACWMCPPEIGPIGELMDRARSYPLGVLYQTVGTMEDSFDIEGMFAAAADHAAVSQRLQKQAEALLKVPFLHLTCGGCHLCPVCAKRTGAPCRHPALGEILVRCGYETERPCGGRGICGKCAVEASGGLSEPTPAEEKAGRRLSCQIVLLGDAEVWLKNDAATAVELSGSVPTLGAALGRRFGAALDLGTTTIAMKLYDLQDGRLLAEEGLPNPQRRIASDVMGRIGAAMDGQLADLQEMALSAIHTLLDRSCTGAGIGTDQVDAMVVGGNTTMLYLLNGRDPTCLSRAPFRADHLFGHEDTLLGIPVYYPSCMNAFVGADITCAVLDSSMTEKPGIRLLCDIGTNGEIALWKDGTLYVTSTAAGPAFEGAGISCGCSSIPGAIDRVWLENGQVKIHTIADKEACGICGSGLIDAIAVFLELERIDETGFAEEDDLSLTENVSLIPADVRAVQLAKGAIAAGIRTLLEEAKVSEEEIGTLFIAGGFGSHLNVASAAAIGLIPPNLQQKVCVLGNAALSGAAKILLNRQEMARAEKTPNAPGM